MEGLALGDEDFSPPGFILPGNPILVVLRPTEVPPNPRVLVPLDSAERRQVWMDPMGLGSQPPRVKLTTRKTIILMGFSCKLKRVSIEALSLGRDHSRLEDH
ncbi:Hypothetical protein FKW44_009598 [Caligus rogercresseyi]|uniref:Uncharacterized protein n=1 Tax=Caligus rogercresseyi TaxID=217165 RepID=A0A7T8K7L2_CALRO|nr:Hypothetical protein FKW44_009598 [Caligus rogercresseyi]